VLGLKLLEHWLWDHGVEAVIVPLSATTSLEDVLHRLRPRMVGISISIAEQLSEVERLVALIQDKAPGTPIVLGGGAVKSGEIAPLPGTSLMADGMDLMRVLSREVSSTASEQLDRSI
jgi:methylmalonyl-CoA mutase cobalamin-binding subunit